LSEWRIALQKAAGELQTNRTQLEQCESRLRHLRDDGKTDEQRRQELDDYAHKRDGARTALNELRTTLHSLPANAAQRAAGLRVRRESEAATVQRLDRLAGEHEAAQRTLLSQGPYTSLADAEEEIARLRLEEEREQLRLEAIRTLWITYQAEKLGALDGLAEPVSRRATELLAEFAGRHLAGLQLSVDFSETAISPAEAAREAPLQEMSGGEQEQILLAVRLALAENLTRAERHMVVLDDVLLNTDDQRLARILDYFERHKDQMQVVILTCHPERYSRIRAACLVEFPPTSVAVTTRE
jgi:DNA repair exonuclease SbcCD ATPase subunit